MIGALVDLARRLPPGTLSPPGYYAFNEGIRFEVHLHRDGRLSVTDHGKEGPYLPRPENGRTSGANARLIADRAKAVLPGGGELHQNYLGVLSAALTWETLADTEVRAAISRLLAAAIDGRLTAALADHTVGDKDWLSFTATVAGRREHLIAHPEVQATWLELLAAELRATGPAGQARHGDCAACGNHGVMIRRTPLKVGVNRSELAPLTSLNQDAYLSFETNFKRAPIALCLTCADAASRALSWLLSTDPHHQFLHLVTRKGQPDFGASATVRAVAWLSDRALQDALQAPLDAVRGPPDDLGLGTLQLPPSEADLARLWATPFTRGQPDNPSIDGADFHLLMVSPIKGHIIFRSHHTLRLDELRAHLEAYTRRAALPVLGDLEQRLASQRDMVEAALRQRSKGRVSQEDPQSGRVRTGLLLHACLGAAPPQGLLLPALHAFHAAVRHPEPTLKNRLALHACACALSLYRSTMDETPASLSGRLLAVIERAQQDSQRRTYGKANAYSVATRTISAAAARPSHVLGQLLPLATKAYLPRASHHHARLTELSAALHGSTGIPARLTPHQQAEFSLGYYAELHRFSLRQSTTPAPTSTLETTP